MKSEDIVIEAELIVIKKELDNIINSGFNVCCPKCHSQEYDIYPTGYYPKDMPGYEYYKDINDIWWKCKKCGEKWPSGFIK